MAKHKSTKPPVLPDITFSTVEEWYQYLFKKKLQ